MACFCKNDNESCGFVNSGEFLGDLLACKLASFHRGVFWDVGYQVFNLRRITSQKREGPLSFVSWLVWDNQEAGFARFLLRRLFIFSPYKSYQAEKFLTFIQETPSPKTGRNPNVLSEILCEFTQSL